MVEGYRCAVCGEFVPVAAFAPWRCPRASPTDPHHVLHLVDGGDDPGGGGAHATGGPRTTTSVDPTVDPTVDPIVAYRRRCAWWAFAQAHAIDDDACVALATDIAAGLTVTPFARSAVLSDAVGAEVWAKDETGNLGGSHKARHLVGILLHLLVAEQAGLLRQRPPLAIASCGNAAIAAATLARRADWPIDVYVPAWISAATGDTLHGLGATIHRCDRRPDDVAGDPALLRFREAVAVGAVPFSVQGPENGLCLDTGRTIGWELGDEMGAIGGSWRVVVQVGGGALAACVGAGLGHGVRLDTVQAAGCAPLAAAWERLTMIDRPERYWSHVMRPWPDPTSAADGILDDETYDWIADVAAMAGSGGRPLVAAEEQILAAHALARQAGFDVSPTGAAGLAGVLALDGELRPGERVAVIMSGVSR